MAENSRIDPAEVLAPRDQGLKIREIAERLGCSMTTVRYHLYPRRRERILRLAAKRRKTEKYRKWFREYNMKRYRSEPEFRSKAQESMRKYMRKRYKSDPEFHARQTEYMKEYNRKRYHSDPEYRAKRLEYAKERYHSDPEFRSKHLQYERERYHSDPEYRAKRLESAKKYRRRRRLEQKKFKTS
jgi:predicted transcriptional regulator